MACDCSPGDCVFLPTVQMRLDLEGQLPLAPLGSSSNAKEATLWIGTAAGVHTSCGIAQVHQQALY